MDHFRFFCHVLPACMSCFNLHFKEITKIIDGVFREYTKAWPIKASPTTSTVMLHVLHSVRFGLIECDSLIPKPIHLPPWTCQSPPQLQHCSLTVAAYHPPGIWQPAASHTYIYSPVTKERLVMRNILSPLAAWIAAPCYATFLCSADSSTTREPSWRKTVTRSVLRSRE